MAASLVIVLATNGLTLIMILSAACLNIVRARLESLRCGRSIDCRSTAVFGSATFLFVANTDYVPTPNEMCLRLELTRCQPNAAASIAPLSVASACDRGEFLLDGTFCRAI